MQRVLCYQFLWVSVEDISQVKWLNPRLRKTSLSKPHIHFVLLCRILSFKWNQWSNAHLQKAWIISAAFFPPFFSFPFIVFLFHWHLQWHLTHPDMADIGPHYKSDCLFTLLMFHTFWEFPGMSQPFPFLQKKTAKRVPCSAQYVQIIPLNRLVGQAVVVESGVGMKKRTLFIHICFYWLNLSDKGVSPLVLKGH